MSLAPRGENVFFMLIALHFGLFLLVPNLGPESAFSLVMVNFFPVDLWIGIGVSPKLLKESTFGFPSKFGLMVCALTWVIFYALVTLIVVRKRNQK